MHEPVHQRMSDFALLTFLWSQSSLAAHMPDLCDAVIEERPVKTETERAIEALTSNSSAARGAVDFGFGGGGAGGGFSFI